MVTMIRNVFTILALSSAVGLLVNDLSPRGIPLEGPVSPREIENLTPIGIEEAWNISQTNEAVFVDARSEAEYRSGHIPGAMLLALERFDPDFSAFRGMVPPETRVVAYCSGEGCDMSHRLAELLRASGYDRVQVFTGGWEQWQAKGYPVEKENP